jgi:protein-S-isoprenylcysteine O-methyltransferase Ste14
MDTRPELLTAAPAQRPEPSAPALAPTSEPRRILGSYAASMAVILAGLYFYTTLSPYYIGLYRLSWRPMLGGYVSPVTIDLKVALWCCAAVYALALPFYYTLRRGRWSNAATVTGFLRRRWQSRSRPRPGPAVAASESERQAMLCLLLKWIFIPFCIHGLLAYLAYTNDQLIDMAGVFREGGTQSLFALYNSHLHYFILNLIFLVDFLPFVVGYLVQARCLGNEVVSVDPSLRGWVACLVCYPPFNVAMVALLPWQVVELAPAYPAFSQAVHLALNGLLLALFACYASASVSLGFKSCNLMHRGVVCTGLYRRIRHPAYLFKNLAWWTGALPLLAGLLQTSTRQFFWTLFCIAGWSAIYLLRALCEERHLSRHADYRAYMTQVPYRFIPGVC